MTQTFAVELPDAARTPPLHAAALSSKDLYFSLSDGPEAAASAAQDYLIAQLAIARALPDDLPAALSLLPGWVHERTEAVGTAYREYLEGRKRGAPRSYFSSRSHALYFLKAVAPTKLVDGAWLYGLLRHWDNPDYHPLIKTYLEELGDGVPDKNHVTVYRKLLATHACDGWDQLDECHFVQGALQLALAYNAERFLPELIGYNLGYEQLPLHLMITSYELNELGIDPYYFTLHVTVDNAANGHAQKAVQALRQLMPRVGDSAEFYRRVRDGYRLNELGTGTTAVIADFNLKDELVNILAAKSVVGKNMHSDYCRVAGRSVNDWLAEPEQIPDFLAALETAGWIKRGIDAEHSRFWRLIHGERAEMFGVFSAYEQQVLRDWIMSAPDAAVEAGGARVPTHRAQRRTLDRLAGPATGGRTQAERGLIRRHPAGRARAADNELGLLEEQVASAQGKQEAMALLGALMSPAHHHTAVGLMATRMYSQLLAA